MLAACDFYGVCTLKGMQNKEPGLSLGTTFFRLLGAIQSCSIRLHYRNLTFGDRF